MRLLDDLMDEILGKQQVIMDLSAKADTTGDDRLAQECVLIESNLLVAKAVCVLAAIFDDAGAKGTNRE